MRLDSPVVAFPSWLGGALPRARVEGNARLGRPLSRIPVVPGSLRARRMALGLTLAAVADRIGISEATVRRIEARKPFARADARVVRNRGRMTDLYRSLERERVAA